MPKAKVCMLTSGHSALDDRIFYKESRTLQQEGHEVTLLAPLDNEGFFFDMGGNRLPYSREATLHGIRIIGFTKGKPSIPRVSAVLQLVRLASIGRLKLGTEPLADLIDKGIQVSADVYHCHELWSLLAGIQIKGSLEKQGRKPKLIYDVHEFHPASELSDAKNLWNRLYNRVLRKAIVHFEKEALKYVDYVITANQITRGYLLTLSMRAQTEVIYNCPVLSIFQEPGSAKTHKNRITICHEGHLRFKRGIKQMTEVMKLLKAHYGNKVELLIIGDVYGEERKYLDEKLEEYDLHATIRCTGWLPYEEVGKAIPQGDIGIIFFEPTENNMLAGPPHKLFNYMRYGLPIVSVDLPETSRIIREAQCGLIVKDRSTHSLAEALSALIDDEDKRRWMGENAEKAAYNQYSWEQMEKRLLRVYAELLPEL